ncbi:MAG: hypothetical protein IIC04_07330, partial [Proteobacteria bacterium]|nr:hypothetical protein [Pseudomonadota bacterium]
RLGQAFLCIAHGGLGLIVRRLGQDHVLGGDADTIIHNGFASDGTDTITGFAVASDRINIDSDLLSTDGGVDTSGSTISYASSAIEVVADASALADSTAGIWFSSEQLAADTTAANAIARAVVELTDTADFAANFSTGEGGLLLMDSGVDTFVFEYKADGTPATTTAGDLTLLLVLDGLTDASTLTATEFI